MAPAAAPACPAGCTFPGTDRQRATITARLSTTIDAAVTNGSQVARAKAAPAAAAATAVEAVWQVAKSPCTLPTCAGSDPWVNIDWPAGTLQRIRVPRT